MTRDEMWKEFENQLKREVHTPMTMSYDDSVSCAESGIEEVVAKWKERLEQESCDCISRAEALKALGEAPYVWTDCDAELQAYEDWRTIKDMLERLPSIAPKESQANVLDKIKEEIENLANLDPSDWNHINAEKCEVVVSIIDKYRESEKINCKATKCENCQNHNYCDYEPQESEE